MKHHRRYQLSLLSTAFFRRVSVCVFLGLFSYEKPLAKERTDIENVSTFDIETLKSRGIDPKLAEFFAQSARFLPGREDVTLYVNGERLGVLKARFDDQGDLCFDRRLLNKAGLIISQVQVSTQETVVERGKQDMSSEADVSSNSNTDSVDTPVEVPGLAIESQKGILQHVAAPISFWATAPAETAISTDESVGDDTCYDFLTAYPQTEVDLRPGKQEVRLIVPQEAFRFVGKDFSQYSRGGAAGLLNYDALTMSTESSNLNTSYTSLSTEAGLNLGDWALRSRQNLIEQNGERRSQHLHTYAQHTIVPLHSMVQVGQIDIASPLFPGASITGLQMLPEATLNQNAAGGVTIEGIAQTSQARVEVKQDGILLHSTVVPAGPFSLKNILLIRSNSNVDVTIFEADGSDHSFSVPAASLHRVNLASTGPSFAVGKVRNLGESDSKEPAVATFANDWLVSDRSKLTAGMMVSSDYTATGLIVDSAPSNNTTLSVGNVLSQSKEEGKRGIQSSITARTKLVENVTASTSVTYQTEGYRDLLDTIENYQVKPVDVGEAAAPPKDYELDRSQTQFSANLGWKTQYFGGGSLGFTQSKSSDGDWGRNLSLSWGRSFQGVSVSATFQKDMAGDAGNAAFLSVSVPLGNNRRLQTRASRSGDRDTQIGMTYNESVSESLGYSLSASQRGRGNGTDLSGNLSATPRYAQVNLGYAQDGVDSSSYNAAMRGALVFHRDGVTASPYQVQDTFGIVSVGDEAGIKIHTPNGTVWTDAGGRAVVPQLSPYSANRIEVATNTLPRNVDIDNGYKSIEVGGGSVSRIDFGVVKVRRVLLNAKFMAGGHLPKGASVLSKEGNYLTTVLDNGQIFLDDADQKSLVVNLPGNNQCVLQFKLPEVANTESYFEQADADCA